MIDEHIYLVVYLCIGLAFALTSYVICEEAVEDMTAWSLFRFMFNQTWLWPGYLLALML